MDSKPGYVAVQTAWIRVRKQGLTTPRLIDGVALGELATSIDQANISRPWAPDVAGVLRVVIFVLTVIEFKEATPEPYPAYVVQLSNHSTL